MKRNFLFVSKTGRWNISRRNSSINWPARIWSWSRGNLSMACGGRRGVSPLGEVEIIHPPGPTYPSLMYALSAKAGLNMTFAEGIPLAFTSPGKVFNGLIEWLEGDYLVNDLCALIEAGALKVPSGNGHVGLTPL